MKINSHKPTVFLTGATGLVGSYLLKILLKNGHKVFVLARAKREKSAKQRVVNVLNFWDKKVYPMRKNHLVVVEGDITQKDMGLNRSDSEQIRREIEQIFHSAAITDLNWPLNIVKKVNVEGTSNILSFALTCHRLKGFNHISTAYVYGNYERVFKESNLKVGQQFKTTYELTKFEAELLIQKYRKKGMTINVYRPSMIIGETTTGKTFQQKHVYQFLKLCKSNIFDTIPLLGGKVSIVPIDITAQAIYFLAMKSSLKNTTFHVFPTKLNLIKDICNVGSRVMGFRVPRFVRKDRFNPSSLTPTQNLILNQLLTSVNFKTKLNSTLTNKTLSDLGFKLPNISNSMVANILKKWQNKK